MYNESELKNFVFYKTWAIYLDKQKDKEKAKEILWQIMRGGVGFDYDTEDESILDIVNLFVMPNIKHAQQRYDRAQEGGRDGGRPRQDIDQTEVFEMHYNGATYQEIADRIGVHKNTIQNRMNEWKDEYKNYKNNKNQEQKTNKNNNKNPEKEIEIEQKKEVEEPFNF